MAQTSTTIIASKSHKADVTGTDISFTATGNEYKISATSTTLNNFAVRDLITVTGTNNAPVAANDTLIATENDPGGLFPINVISNDTGPAHVIASTNCKLHLVLSNFTKVNQVAPKNVNVTYTQSNKIDKHFTISYNA